MLFFAPVLFGLSASLDALLLGICYGIRGITVRLWENLLISFITLLGTCLSIGFGILLMPLLPAATATILGSAVLIILGMYYLTKPLLAKLNLRLFPHKAKENVCEEDLPARTSLKEALLIGITLSVNNMSIGFVSGIAGLHPVPTAIITLLFSIVFLYLGNRMGRSRVFKFASRLADPVSGGLLVLLGLLQLLL